MATFQYIAKDPAGQQVAGAIQAESQAAAVRALDERNLFPVHLDEQRTTEASGGRIGASRLAQTYGQLGDLLGAGVPLMRALETLLRTLRAGTLRSAIQKLGQDVAGGDALADAMAQQPGVFPRLHVAMVRAGERGGFLENVLADLARYLERQAEVRSQIQGAMIYPVLLVIVGFAVVIGMLLFIVPRFRDFFEGVVLPLPSRVMFAASDLLTTHWPVGLLLVAVLGLIVWAVLVSRGGKRLIDALLPRIPIIGPAIRMLAISRFCRVLGTLLQSGVPILTALSVCRDAAGLKRLEEGVDEAIDRVRAGESLSEPLRRTSLFPPEIIEMIAVAEESNQMEKTLTKIADAVEQRTQRRVDVAVRLSEPAALIGLAAAIGFIALGLLLPIFNMANTLR